MKIPEEYLEKNEIRRSFIRPGAIAKQYSKYIDMWPLSLFPFFGNFNKANFANQFHTSQKTDSSNVTPNIVRSFAGVKLCNISLVWNISGAQAMSQIKLMKILVFEKSNFAGLPTLVRLVFLCIGSAWPDKIYLCTFQTHP